ncbi:MAG TPA: regulatory iron-sulfur-containing complex subunit RicT [Phycisphaerales bacterium]|nr:regulatory iron-sulfur-containing complex subunit RicT [Phycisphaerales bacterium]
MSIFPLPVFETDADPRYRDAMSDEEIYARLEPPKTIVVKFGAMKLVGEFPYDGTAKPGCGSKLVARTYRGTELVEMLTTTCSNSGCGKSVTRKEMLDYIENSGGKDYPFQKNGRILRVATIDDLNKQSQLESLRKDAVRFCKAMIAEQMLPMKLVDVEPILGEELLTFYYMSEDRVDFRELVRALAAEFKTRIEMRQVGARDEARLVADYEKCGQHCCCKNFLKVLKPVSMRSAKVQKATLDPLKISGRCGRLMCCLRYEDQTYKELKANLPAKNKRVGTSEGPGIVIDSKILVQLVLVRLEHDNREIAVPVEELMDPAKCPTPAEAAAERERIAAEADPFRGMSEQQVVERTEGVERTEKPDRQRGRRKRKSKDEQQAVYRERSITEEQSGEVEGELPAEVGEPAEKPASKRRRRRSKRPRQDSPQGAQPPTSDAPKPTQQGGGKRRRRRGRRRGGGASGQGAGGESS